MVEGEERNLVVLYGSQTGTAKEVAERVGREGARLHFAVQVAAMDSFATSLLPASRLVVYVASTTGQGEVPDNMRASWRKLLRRSLPATLLAGQSFGVLGLGDSSYPKFNFVAKKLARRLAQLGGRQLVPPGLGDDQHDLGPDFVVDGWLERWWALALQHSPLPPGVKPIPRDVIPPPRYQVIWLDGENGTREGEGDVEVEKPVVFGPERPMLAPLLSCERVTPAEHFQDTRLVRLRCPGLAYRPGDVALVQPSNLPDMVDTFFELFPGLDPERRFLLEPSSPHTPLPAAAVLPRPCTVRRAVTTFLDIQAVPTRWFFELLSHFSEDELEKEKCLEFNTGEGQQDLYEYCNRPRRHILEVLYDFRHSTPNIPFNYLLDLIPAIKPRSFSIASSPSVHGEVLELLVAVVRYRSSLQAPRRGLCSTWLAGLPPGALVPVWSRRGALTFPAAPGAAVMVGPGTGVAPFRSYCLETPAASRLLFFGCRSSSADFYFKEEWGRAGVEVVTAFSRDQEDKVYVQHRMEERAEQLADAVLDRGAAFLVAGNSKQMPAAVRAALVAALAARLGEEQGEQYVAAMEAGGRYQTETWA